LLNVSCINLGDIKMRILLVTSGYKGIYEWFESWIQTDLSKKHEVTFFDFEQGISALQSIVQFSKPDLVLTLVGLNFPTSMLHWLKQHGIKTAGWFTEDPYYIDQTLKLVNEYDYVFTIDSASLEYYQKKGHNQAYHLPLATNPTIFMPKQVEEKYRSDICLVGYPYPDRINYVKLLLQYTSYKILLVGNWKPYVHKFRRKENLIIHEGWVEPQVVANYYNGAKIVLNTHRPPTLRHNQNKLGVTGKSINNRTFDVAACSAFQLIEFKEDLPQHFMEEVEIVSFKSLEELLEKTHHFINADAERKNIANKARERVLKEHTFQHRLDKLVSLIDGSS
jgi:spore maturation protein CgeB